MCAGDRPFVFARRVCVGLPDAASMEKVVTAPVGPPASGGGSSFAAYRNRLLGWTTTQLGLSVSAARPRGAALAVAASPPPPRLGLSVSAAGPGDVALPVAASNRQA